MNRKINNKIKSTVDKFDKINEGSYPKKVILERNISKLRIKGAIDSFENRSIECIKQSPTNKKSIETKRSSKIKDTINSFEDVINKSSKSIKQKSTINTTKKWNVKIIPRLKK